MWPSLSITKPEPVAVPRWLLGHAERRVGLLGDLGADEDDARAVALVDLVDGQAAPCPRRCSRTEPGDGLCTIVVFSSLPIQPVATASSADDEDDEAAEQAGDEGVPRAAVARRSETGGRGG